MTRTLTPPRWFARLPRPRRPLHVAVTTALLTMLVLAAGFVAAQPASALVCDPSQRMPAIAGTGQRGVPNELLRSTAFEPYSVVAYSANEDVRGYPDGLGLKFDTFGLNGCGDSLYIAGISTANMLWTLFALLPLKALGTVLDWTMGGNIARELLEAAEPVIAALNTNVFAKWAPLVIMLSLCGLIIKIVRGRGQQGWGGLAWMVGVIALVGLVSTPDGLKAAQTLNDYTAAIAKDAILAPLGADASESNISDSLLDAMVGQVWGQGALGELGAEKIPLQLTFTQNSDVPDIAAGDWTVTVPDQAIPSVIPGAPTWAETWRWTGAYTTAESSRLISIGAEASRCSISGSSPETIEVSNASSGALAPKELCSYKWIIRAAMLSTMVEDYPDAWQTARGVTSGPNLALASALLLIPALGMIAFLGINVIAAEVKMVLWVMITPVVGLFGIRDVAVIRRWGDKIAGSVYERLATALTMGIGLLCLALISALVPGNPIATGILSALVMINVRKIGRELLSLLQQAAGAQDTGGADGEKLMDKGAGFAKQAGMAAAGAAAGGMAAGKGAGFSQVLKGAGRGGLASMNRRRGLLGSVSRGAGGGRQVSDDYWEAKDKLAKDAKDAASPEGQAAAQDEVDEALGLLLTEFPALAREIAQMAKTAAEVRDKAHTAVQDAQNELLLFDQGSRQRVTLHRDNLSGDVAAGLMSPEQADAAAISLAAEERTYYRREVTRKEKEFTAADEKVSLAEHGIGSELLESIHDAVARGSGSGQIAAQLNLSRTASDALQEYVHVRRQQSRIYYSAVD